MKFEEFIVYKMDYFLHINGNITQLPRRSWLKRWCKPYVRELYCKLARQIKLLVDEGKLFECKFVADDGCPVHWICLIDTFHSREGVSARGMMRIVIECVAKISPQHSKLFAFGYDARDDSDYDSDSESAPVLWGSRAAQIRRLLTIKRADEVKGSCPYVVFDGLKYTKKNGQPIWMIDIQELVCALVDHAGGAGELNDKYDVQLAEKIRLIHDEKFIGLFE